MSTAAEDPTQGDGQPPGWRTLILRTVAAVAAAASIVALWAGERARVADDLQLFAESGARPGETLALRALLLRDVEAASGPTLGRADVRVRLLDAEDRELAAAPLRPTVMESMEGSLRVPDIARGKLTLEAHLARDPTDNDAKLSVRRTLHVLPTIARSQPIARSAGPLQHFAQGRVRALGDSTPPSPLEARVIGGACVPEQTCHLMVWVGEPAAALTIVPSAAFTLLQPFPPAIETNGLVSFALQLHGAEAEVTLRALRAGRPVAECAVRLPVALGESAIASDRAIAPSLSALALTLFAPPGREHLILDTFVDGRWAQSKTVDHASPSASARVDPIRDARGIVRVQARSDRYSAEGSGTRVLYVRSQGESTEQALSSIARAAREAGLRDGLTDSVERTPAPQVDDAERWAAFMLAPFEGSRMPIPLAASGRPARLARLAGVRTFLRFGLGAMLIGCAFVVGASVWRTGFAASEQALSILDPGRESTHASQTSRMASRLWVALWVVLVAIAFLAAALLVVAKPLWF